MATLAPDSAGGQQSLATSATILAQDWPFNAECFDPDLEYENDVAEAFKEVEKDQLSTTTSLNVLRVSEKLPSPQESKMNDEQVIRYLSARGGLSSELELFTISRLSGSSSTPGSAVDYQKLQIGRSSFRSLMSSYEVPVTLITAICRPYMVWGTGFRRLSATQWDFWCLIPIRAVLPCRFTDAKMHERSTAGSNQMDPFHYIHLTGEQSYDIRSSHIGIFVRHNVKSGGTAVIVINLLDARQRHLIEEPLSRTRKAMKRRCDANLRLDPRFAHLVYLSSALRWWNNALLCFNQYLVKHEKVLQEEIAKQTSAFSDRSKDINSSLHLMAAHLHRYKSELERIRIILSELLSPKFEIASGAPQEGTDPDATKSEFEVPPANEADLKLEQLMSQVKAITGFADEIEGKIRDVLNLLFHQIQATNDKTLQAILTAAQTDAKLSQKISLQSHQLTVSMRNDSIAMKTIAILTMLFLPATSFAAILSMPFFNQAEYLIGPSHVWIWIILTVSFTLIAFGIFAHVIGRQQRAADANEDGTQDVAVASGQDKGDVT